MRTNRTTRMFCVSVGVIALASSPARSQTTDVSQPTAATPFVATSEMTSRFAQIAPGIVKTAGLGAGKTAVVRGGAFMLPFMQQLAIEIERTGATALMIVTTDPIQRQQYAEPAAQKLQPPDRLTVGINRNADIFFTFPMTEDNSIYSNPTPEQLKVAEQATALWKPVTAKRREVFVAIPLPRNTVFSGMPYADYSRQMWESMSADHSQIAATGASISQRLANAKKIHVTSPEGTDITFALVKGATFVDAGPANTFAPGATRQATTVPGGQLYALINQSSATGKVRAAWDYCKASVKDEAIDVDKGNITAVRAASDEACVKDTMGTLHVSFMSIGLNPAHPNVPTGTSMATDFTSPGLVLIGFGGNGYLGGTNTEQGQWTVPLERATVAADGVVIVRDGAIVPAQRQAQR